MTRKVLKLTDGETFTGMLSETLEVFHAEDGSAVGVTFISSDMERSHVVIDWRLMKTLPAFFQEQADKAAELRELASILPDRFE